MLNPNIDVLTGKPFASSTGSLTDEQKKIEFINYVEHLSVDKKAEMYVNINGILPEADIDSGAELIVQKVFPTIESQKEFIASILSSLIIEHL